MKNGQKWKMKKTTTKRDFILSLLFRSISDRSNDEEQQLNLFFVIKSANWVKFLSGKCVVVVACCCDRKSCTSCHMELKKQNEWISTLCPNHRPKWNVSIFLSSFSFNSQFIAPKTNENHVVKCKQVTIIYDVQCISASMASKKLTEQKWHRSTPEQRQMFKLSAIHRMLHWKCIRLFNAKREAKKKEPNETKKMPFQFFHSSCVFSGFVFHLCAAIHFVSSLKNGKETKERKKRRTRKVRRTVHSSKWFCANACQPENSKDINDEMQALRMLTIPSWSRFLCCRQF